MTLSTPAPPARRRRRLALPVVLAGSLASLILALGLSPTVAAFTASIQNTVDTAGAGSLTMRETDSAGTTICNSTDGGSVSTNSATCSTINKYGGNVTMTPGQTVTTSVNITNTGSVKATAFSLTPGTCTQAASATSHGTASDLCSQMTVAITSGSSTLYSGTLAGLTASIDVLNKIGSTGVTAGTTIPVSFAVTLPSSIGGTYSNLQVSQVLTWTFTS